jgi:hypothetical protein
MHRRHAAREARPNPEPAPVQTVVSIVYYTAPQTFAGAVGGYSTQSDATAATSAASGEGGTASASQSSSIAADTSSSASTSSQTTLTTSTSATTLPTVISSPTATAGTVILAATGGISSSISGASTATSTTSAASSSASAASSSGGMSTAGKAGLAIGILLLLGAVLSLVLFCFKRKREAMNERLNDEKRDSTPMPIARDASTRTNPKAPRLSLRLTKFVPNLMEKRQSRGNILTTTPPIAEDAEWDQPSLAQLNNREVHSAQSNNSENPFGNHAETIDSANANGPAIVQDTTSGEHVVAAAAAGAGAATAATIGLARGASKRENALPRMDFTTSGPLMGPPSPAGTEFSMSSQSPSVPPVQTATGVAIAAAGGPANSAVYRVQLDFNPSMEDELELHAGQLIRMLHEYDDGWALCIRLDRSQQGVVPRTCLSTRPVKPRPQQNSPRGPPPPGMRVPQGMPPPGSARPMTPNGQQPKAMTANQQRPMTPSQQQRAMTPTGGQQFPLTPSQEARSMSPGSQQRSASPAQVPLPESPRAPSRPSSPSGQHAGRKGPPGPSPMNPVAFIGAGSPPTSAPIRKPVPGQAL